MESWYHFYEEQIRIKASSVGISKERWISIKDNEINGKKEYELMRDNRFDQLPIIGKNKIVTDYFKTNIPNNYNEIKRHKIKYEDTIPLDMKIENVIEKFDSNKQEFYFLAHHNKISGLITLSDLNCKQVKLYIFSLICELERKLSDFLNICLDNKKIEEWTKNQKNKPDSKNKYQQILTKYNKDKEANLENQLTEYFYFVYFLNIIKDNELYKKLSFSKYEWEKLNSINNLRNSIAHPTRRLLDNENNVNKLQKRLNKIKKLIFNLTTFLKKNIKV